MKEGGFTSMMHRFILPVIILCLNVHALYAMENKMQKDIEPNLDNGWYSKNDPANAGLDEAWQNAINFGEGWKEYNIPDYWTRHSIRREASGVTWYAKKFSIDNPEEDLALYVSGIDDEAFFYLNGQEVGKTVGYSEDLSFDTRGLLKNGENFLAVRLNRPAGMEKIYSPVSLVRREDLSKIARLDVSKEYARPSAEWVKDAVIYELYPRSFSKGESFLSIIRKIPELKKLGVTVLWVMPINPIGKLHRKGTLGSPYSIQNYYKINPEYGTLADFEKLVKAVHHAGMHIIIDLVINHTAWDNPLIKEHPDWYKHGSTGKIVVPNPDWTDVAQLDYSHKGLRQYMIKMMKYWVKDVGIDGFRCDVAELVPLDFWDEARAALDSIKPVMMLAEGAKPDLHLKAFDLTYSWNIYDVLGKIFNGRTPASAIDSVLERESRTYPKGALRLRFNTNHDENAFDAPSIERYGPGGDSLTIALIATLPGVPLIYNGDEVGNAKRLSLFEQVPIDWNERNGFRELYEKIYDIRKAHPELKRGSYKMLPTSDERNVFAFERKLGDRIAVCVFNFSKLEKKNIKISVSGLNNLNFIDDVTGERFPVKSGKLEISLREYGFMILSPNPDKAEPIAH